MTPLEVDTALAGVWQEIYRAESRLQAASADLKRLAGAKWYYRGRNRVTDMDLDEALEKVQARAAYVTEYKAAHVVIDGDYRGTDWSEYEGSPWEADRFGEALARYTERQEALETLHGKARDLEALYTGWSRFFLVTSSAGHVHSSTACSTCRPTTRFGWLPGLSGKSEAEAVTELGPTLCTHCFPSAPTAWTSGKKLTAAQALKKAA